MLTDVVQNSFDEVVATPLTQRRYISFVNDPILWIDSIDVDFCGEFNGWWLIWVFWPALNSQVIYTSFIRSLKREIGKEISRNQTRGGPKIIPLQRVNVMSSSSSKPQEMLPSRFPF